MLWKVSVGMLTFCLVLRQVDLQDESQSEVTIDMLVLLEQEILSLNSRIGVLQEELQVLAAKIQALGTETAVVGNIELAELQELITASNQQEESLQRLLYLNGIWRKNFRIVNATFGRLRSSVVFPQPNLGTPVAISRPLRMLPEISGRTNTTLAIGRDIRNYKLGDLTSFKNLTFPVKSNQRRNGKDDRTYKNNTFSNKRSKLRDP